MARGDSLYARTFVDWPNDPRCQRLSVLGKWLNHCLWLIAVKEKRETLPIHWTYNSITTFGQVPYNSRTRAIQQLAVMDEIGLITIHENKQITVHGVRNCHKKLKWRDEPYDENTPHTGPIKAITKRESKRESKSTNNGAEINPEDPFFRQVKKSEQRSKKSERDNFRQQAVLLVERYSDGVKFTDLNHHNVEHALDLYENYAMGDILVALKRMLIDMEDTPQRYRPSFQNGMSMAKVKHLLRDDWSPQDEALKEQKNNLKMDFLNGENK